MKRTEQFSCNQVLQRSCEARPEIWPRLGLARSPERARILDRNRRSRVSETAKDAASKAMEFLPNLAEAYLAQGYVHYYCEHDYDSAIASFEKAEQLSPNNSQ